MPTLLVAITDSLVPNDCVALDVDTIDIDFVLPGFQVAVVTLTKKRSQGRVARVVFVGRRRW